MVEEILGSALKRRLDRGEDILLLDVRDLSEYKKEHLPGAVHMLIEEMNHEKLKALDRTRLVVTYSEDMNCPASRIAAEMLDTSGYNVLNYQGSFDDWKDSGYPTVKNV